MTDMLEEARYLDARAKEARLADDDLLLERVAREMIALGEQRGHRETVAWGNYHLGVALNNLNRGTEAEAAARRALAVFEDLGDEYNASKVRMNLAVIELDVNVDAAEARRLFEASLPAIRASGETIRLGIALGNLGEILRLEGDYRAAIKASQESLDCFRQIEQHSSIALQMTNIALCQSLLRDEPSAFAGMREAFEHLRLDPNPRWIAWYFDTWVIIAARAGRLEEAARLLGFVDRFRDERNLRRLQGMLPWLSIPKEEMARAFGGDRLDALLAAGEALTLEEAHGLAIAIEQA
jgi:tetratricopeptide (TPR) repeat protein